MIGNVETETQGPLGLGVALTRAAVDAFELGPVLADEALTRVALTRAIVARAGATGAAPDWSAGELFAAAVLHAFMRALIARYEREVVPGAMDRALSRAAEVLGNHALAAPFAALEELHALPDDLGATERARELTLLRLANDNPALRRYRALFTDTELQLRARYRRVVAAVEEWYDLAPALPGLGMTLFQALRAPIDASPDDLEGQLAFILGRWPDLVPAELRAVALKARDLLRELTLARGHGPGPAPVLRFGQGAGAGGGPLNPWAMLDPEYEAFTQDRDWMSNVVLLARSTWVWLDQLSRTWDRPIRRLDEIPDAELERLGRWGFTGLWLIGLWERSPASRDIKQRMGNPDALSSAYSLYDYAISEELGGEAAWADLARRAWRYGIRLAADMVPNHVGVYSRWIVEHPDRFLQLRHPPFPAYSFEGPDLSRDDRVGVFIEEGYWTHRDAAVVFKRLDRHTGDVRYIYHGNDGTHMPWNDTAQIDFLNPEAREAVIQEILRVARMFPIVRFDAAMTLARRHVRRLWHPAPGEGGAVPSRAEYGVSPEEFDARMPVEFWREVVDRVQAEVPDCLLLAEAFWLMEGYFVRTLGMHRVYNSAFMNMLKDEDNSKYRETLRNVLEFSPPVLGRFVNFLNNPDEEAAAVQFGKGDKYIGVATLMVTMPGLPMFGHGQIEGLHEKYGMEYARARWDEEPDPHLVQRHEAVIFPLMRARHLFSGSEHFALFDLNTGYGVNEAVYAYSNRVGQERALVFYNNRFDSTSGAIHTSVAYNVGPAEAPALRTRSISEALGLRTDAVYAFQEHLSGLWHIRTGRDFAEHGFFIALQGYETRVFWNFREILHPDEHWWALAHNLGMQGVEDIDAAYEDQRWSGRIRAFERLVDFALTPDVADLDRGAWSWRLLEVGVEPDASNLPERVAHAAHVAELLAAAQDTEDPALRAPEARREALALRLLALADALPAAAVPARHLRRVFTRTLGADLGAALVEARGLPDGARFAALAERAWDFLGVNRWDGALWFRQEPMQALLEAWRLHQLLQLTADADITDLTACDVAHINLAAQIEQSAWRLDHLLASLAPAPPAAALDAEVLAEEASAPEGDAAADDLEEQA